MLIYRKVLLIILITASSLLLSLSGKAQFQFIDTISSSLHHKPKFFLDLGSYNSIVNGQQAIFTDIAVGVCFNKRLYFTSGISVLNTEVISSQVIRNDSASYYVN